jgi:hypothetical protein
MFRRFTFVIAAGILGLMLMATGCHSHGSGTPTYVVYD